MSVDLNAISNLAQARIAIQRGYFNGEKLSQSDIQQLKQKYPEITQEAQDNNEYPDFTMQDMNSTLMTGGAGMGAAVGGNAVPKQVGAFGNGDIATERAFLKQKGVSVDQLTDEQVKAEYKNFSKADAPKGDAPQTGNGGEGGQPNADELKNKADNSKSNNILLYAAAGVVVAGAAYYKIAKPGEDKNQEVMQSIQQDLPALDADNQEKTEESIAAQEEAQALAEEAQEAVEEAEGALSENEAVASEGNVQLEALAERINNGEATDDDIEKYEALKEEHDYIIGDNEGLQADVSDAVGEQADAIDALDETFVAANETIVQNDEINAELAEKGEKAETQAQMHEILAGVGGVAGQAVGIAGGIVAAKDAAKPFVGWGLVAADIAAGVAGMVAGSVMSAESQKQGMFKDNAANEQNISNNVADNSNIAKGTVDTMQSDTQTLGADTRGTEVEVPDIDEEVPEAEPSNAPEKSEEGKEDGGTDDAGYSLFGTLGKDDASKTDGTGDDSGNKKVKGSSGSSGT